MLRVLDLFSGIGGFSLGLERTGGFETVAFCEIDPFCRKVLAKHWPDVPIYEDVRTINDWIRSTGTIFDVLTGGYPCQPFSHAGKRRGEEDDRHLWPAMLEVIKTHRPAWVIGENVAGHISMGLDPVLSDLEGEGYTARPYVIPACAVDAPHRRDRVWIVGHSGGTNVGKSPGRRLVGEDILSKSGWEQDKHKPHAPSEDVGDPTESRCDSRENGSSDAVRDEARLRQPERRCGGQRAAEWLPEPNVGRVANGVPQRVDRLRSLGNAVVPQIPEMLGHAILEAGGVT